MATKVMGKINGKIKFLYRKNRFLEASLRRLLCNALVQPHFDYACSAWYPNLTQNLRKKLQTTQNKCIRFCLQLGNRSHIGATEFKQINWLPIINERFSQCVCSTIFKFFKNNCPAYMDEMFSTYRKTLKGQKGLPYLGPSLWNKIDTECKLIANLTPSNIPLRNHFLINS